MRTAYSLINGLKALPGFMECLHLPSEDLFLSAVSVGSCAATVHWERGRPPAVKQPPPARISRNTRTG